MDNSHNVPCLFRETGLLSRIASRKSVSETVRSATFARKDFLRLAIADCVASASTTARRFFKIDPVKHG